MKRAERRHKLKAIKKRVESYYGGHPKGKPRQIGRLANTRTPCSCYMCCNPRRHGKRTIQEMKHLEHETTGGAE